MALISTVPPLTGGVDPLDADLVQGDGTSTYRLNLAGRSAGRAAWEFWASHVLLMVKVPEFTLYDWREWRQQPIKDGSLKTNGAKLAELRMKHPDLSWHIDDAIAGKAAP